MKKTMVALLACAVLPATLRAAPFEEARVTETVNIVSLLRQLQRPQPATIGDVIKGETALKTGGDSRAELKFPDLTLTRVGSNSLFRFHPGGRDMTLDAGTMLFHSPRGAGGGKVQAGAVTAAVTGSAVSVLNLSPVIWVVCLEHSALVSGPGFTRKIREGEAIDQNGKVIKIDLLAFYNSSNLCNWPTPLPIRIASYRQPELDVILDTSVDRNARLAQRTIAGNQPPPVNGGQTTTTPRRAVTTFPVVTTTTPASVSPIPPPQPTPKPHKPRKPHRPPKPPQEGPGEGEGGGQVGR